MFGALSRGPEGDVKVKVELQDLMYDLTVEPETNMQGSSFLGIEVMRTANHKDQL